MRDEYSYRPPVPGVECRACGGPLVRRAGQEAYYCETCHITRLPVPRGTKGGRPVEAPQVVVDEDDDDESVELTDEELRDLVGDD